MTHRLYLFLIALAFTQACQVTKKITYNRLNNNEVCQLEKAYYPMADGIFRVKKGISKDQKAVEYLDIVDFINVYNKEGFLIASTGNGTCEFSTLADAIKGKWRPDTTKTIQTLFSIIEPICLNDVINKEEKTTIVVGSAQFLDKIPTYKSRRKVLNERLREFSRTTTSIFVVNFDLRPDSASQSR